MKKSVSLRPFNSTVQPHYKWVVYWPHSIPGKSKKARRFRTKEDAQEFAEKKERELVNHGRKKAGVSNRQVEDALWAVAELEKHGANIRDVVADYLARLDQVGRSVKMNTAFPSFLEVKEAAGRSPRYIADLRARCGRFLATHGEKCFAEVEVGDVESWLARLEVGAVTRNSFRRSLSVFFTWAVKRGYCLNNPVEHTEKAKEFSERVDIFTPGQLRLIMKAAPAELRAFYAIGAFAGLRSSEIEQLQWEDLDLKKNRIDVAASKTKGAASRYVPIPEALADWLGPLRKPSGKVTPGRCRKRRTAFHADLLQVLLENAPRELVPLLAIEGFTQLTREEARAVQWEDVGLGETNPVIRVTTPAGKRTVKLKPELAKWLAPLAVPAGPVARPDVDPAMARYYEKLENREILGVLFKDNALRHSFGSYALAQTENAAKVALWMGHDSTKMIFAHYRERVDGDQAREWFNIRPDLDEGAEGGNL